MTTNKQTFTYDDMVLMIRLGAVSCQIDAAFLDRRTTDPDNMKELAYALRRIAKVEEELMVKHNYKRAMSILGEAIDHAQMAGYETIPLSLCPNKAWREYELCEMEEAFWMMYQFVNANMGVRLTGDKVCFVPLPGSENSTKAYRQAITELLENGHTEKANEYVDEGRRAGHEGTVLDRLMIARKQENSDD